MKLLQNKPKFNYLPLAFLAPIFGMCVVMCARGFIPFGDTSMLYSDMYHQYYPFFVAFRKALLSGESLLYSWNVGMGMDYLGLIAYYLASPLNLFSVLLPESMLLGYFSLLMPIKLGFASLFFAYFLHKLFGKNDVSLILFGSLYALCAWSLGYQWNIMWLDTFALLPLVTLGTVCLLRDKKVVLYTISLFLSIFANYYIGLFTCIFVALSFFCYEICCWRGFKRFFCDLGRIALFSILAIGMTAILELPAFAALQTTQSSVNNFPTTFRLNIAKEHTWKGLMDAMRQVAGNMNSGVTLTFKEGLPNVFCGVCANVLAVLFLISRHVKLRERICCACLLLLFTFSFIIRQLDYIWHGFHFPNMIPYRFSFLFSFVLLYMAYRAWLLRDRFRGEQVVFAIVTSVCITLCAQDLTDWQHWLFNGVLLLAYGIALLYPKVLRLNRKNTTLSQRTDLLQQLRSRRKFSAMFLLLIILVELALNLVNFGIDFVGTTVNDYPRGTTKTATLVDYMHQREEGNLFFRAETTHSQTLNDGALNGYNGVSTFTSSANVKVTEFMRALGYGAKNTYNRYCYEESSPVSNLFLNLKYMLERQNKVEPNPYFQDLHQYGNVHLLENAAYLPLGFLANTELADVDFEGYTNTFLLQNDLFRAATGCPENVWTTLGGKNLSISGTGVTITSQTDGGYCAYYTDPERGGTIVYKYIAPSDGFICVSLDLSKKNKFSFWKDGIELYNETYSIPQTLSVCQVSAGEIIEVHLVCKAGERGTISLQTGLLNDDVFWTGYDRLAASTLALTAFTNTEVAGTIQCDRNGILYTSIPQNGNWSAFVDGEPAQIVLIGDAMIGVMLSEGNHSIRFVYHNAAFALGWKISVTCTLIFGGLLLTVYKPVHYKGKYEKHHKSRG